VRQTYLQVRFGYTEDARKRETLEGGRRSHETLRPVIAKTLKRGRKFTRG
jgi:hypothetical protein